MADRTEAREQSVQPKAPEREHPWVRVIIGGSDLQAWGTRASHVLISERISPTSTRILIPGFDAFSLYGVLSAEGFKPADPVTEEETTKFPDGLQRELARNQRLVRTPTVIFAEDGRVFTSVDTSNPQNPEVENLFTAMAAVRELWGTENPVGRAFTENDEYELAQQRAYHMLPWTEGEMRTIKAFGQ